jgi:hypothetical protein
MKTDKEFDNILDECLERLLVEGETIEQCLKRYPEQAAELEPLLQTALEAREASTIQPRAEFKARARYQFRSALGEASPKSRPFLGWLPRWATVVAIVLVVLLAGGGTMVVASNSMPDSPLYAVKLATEEARLMLTPSELGKARLCAELVDRRVEEIIYMAGKGDVQQIELVTQRLDERLEKLAVLALALGEQGGDMLLAPSEDEEAAVPEDWGGHGVRAGANGWSELRMKVASHAAENQAALQAMLEEAPGAVKSALRRAIEVSLAGYQKALEALD